MHGVFGAGPEKREYIEGGVGPKHAITRVKLLMVHSVNWGWLHFTHRRTGQVHCHQHLFDMRNTQRSKWNYLTSWPLIGSTLLDWLKAS